MLGATYIEKKNARKRAYYSIINNHRIVSIDEIASSLSISYEQARKDINKMIKQGFFGSAHIDDITRSVFLPVNGIDINTKVVVTDKICPSCGATNRVSSLGENKRQHCGTLLS